MESDSTERLKFATRRAKSDVANKLVSMCLHQLSRRMTDVNGYRVEDEQYQQAVKETFGNECPYCNRNLDSTSAIIEHLDGMNRLRAGLHIPGNVLMACKLCNNEKRRDDSKEKLLLAEYGWENFLSHDGTHCPPNCKTCKYWEKLWPESAERQNRLQANRERIHHFRVKYLSQEARSLSGKIAPQLQVIYKRCQNFADELIEELVNDIIPVSK